MREIIPQNFPATAKTVLAPVDFIEQLKSIPLVYQNAPNFMGIAKSIATKKQYYYDVIRSLTNAINLESVNDSTSSSACSGDYLKICATYLTAKPVQSDDDDSVRKNALLKRTFILSRGTIADFYNYYELTGLAGIFNNDNVKEAGNLTLQIKVNYDAASPEFIKFSSDMVRIKAAGVKLSISSLNVMYFQLSTGYGFGYIDENGYTVNMGCFKTLQTG